MSQEITIRPAESPADYRACQQAQRLAWGIQEDGYVVPVATLVAAQLHGGLVLGAFRPDGSAVGLSFAFLGRSEGRPCLYSQLTGVIPGYQDRGIGGDLKRRQFAFARDSGIELLVWAFDPLQSGNARFNLARLGATAGRYVVDMYGPRTDALNLGTPTDRLIAEWATTPRERAPLDEEAVDRLPDLLANDRGAFGDRTPGEVADPTQAPRWLLEIPSEIGDLRRRDPSLADAWRLAVRRAFLAAFEAGLRAVDFRRRDDGTSPRAFYVLERDAERPPRE